MKTYWISFVKHHKNVGIIITDADSEEAAVSKTKNMGLCPGGQAALFEMDITDPVALKEIEHWGKDRVIKPEALLSERYQKIGDLPVHPNERVTIICEQCVAGVPHSH